jgi:hypothetical protein
MDAPTLTRPRNSAGAAPPRPAGSVRRTSSIDVFWPDGQGGDMAFVGRARDLLTPAVGAQGGGVAVVLAEDGYDATVGADRTIRAIEAFPARPALAGLVGERGGGRLRGALAQIVPEERAGATPLYLILDDLSGVSLIAGWAWSNWKPDWLAHMRAAMSKPGQQEAFNKSRENVCIGHIPGASAFAPDRDMSFSDITPAPDLRAADDPSGWHAFPVREGANLRRARRIDVSLVDGRIVIDSAFQDTGSLPSGGRAALHEYRLGMTADLASGRILSVDAEPRVLPFVECPSATVNLRGLVGTRLADLRESVLAQLAGPAGCTHLNDALRALAEAPALAAMLG